MKVEPTFIYGRNSVIETLQHRPQSIKVIYVSGAVGIPIPPDIPVVKKRKTDLDRLVSQANHQGIVAELVPFTYTPLAAIIAARPSIILLLDHIQDPHNLGAILRSVNASGTKAVIIPQDRAATLSSGALKAASGGEHGLMIARVNSLQTVLIELKRANYWIYAAQNAPTATSFHDLNFTFPLALVMGNEATGVAKSLSKEADALIKIPQAGTVESLNVSVATGIILFEIIKHLERN